MHHSLSVTLSRSCVLASCVVGLALVGGTARAADPLETDLGLDWWHIPYDTNAYDSGTAARLFGDPGTPNGFTEIWLSRQWGVRGARYESSLDDIGIDNSDHTSIDFKRRFFSLSDNSFISLGAGWESIGLDSGESSSGPRLTAGGRVGVGESLSLYGHTSWLPELDDVGTRSNLEGQEFEAGLSFEPAPFVSVRLGFRRFKLDFDEGGSSNTAESEGFILGAGFHW